MTAAERRDWPMAADLYGEMQLSTAPAATRQWRDVLPGVAIVIAASLAAAWLADHYDEKLRVLMGLMIGLALSFVSQDKRTHAGLDLLSQTALRIGIVLVGARITASQLVELGPLPFVMLLGIMLSVMLMAVVTAPLFKQDKLAGLLAGGATAICGASAALALYTLIGKHRIDQARFTLTLVGVTLASAMAMSLYPILAQLLGFSDQQAGFLIGASIHDVAQALGAGFSVSTAAGEVATIVKLTRVALLVPMLMLVALWLNRQDSAASRSDGTAARTRIPVRLPWFITGFIVLAAVNSMISVPETVHSVTNTAAQALLLMAIVATAMKSQLHILIGQGWRCFAPIAVATLTSFVLALGAATLL